jgi:GTP-binding protein
MHANPGLYNSRLAMASLTTARFHTTVAALHQLPAADMPEVAFVGRSNAGKSSAINVLCNRKRLAFASRTPGRTQSLNYFAVGPDERIDGFLVDTPGYGYAAAPLEMKRNWDRLAGEYLQRRPQLVGVVLMADIRRELTELDCRLIDWIEPGVPLLVVLTKADKLGQQQRQAALRSVRQRLAAMRPEAADAVMLFSALDRSGRDGIVALIERWLKPAADTLKPAADTTSAADAVAAAADPRTPAPDDRGP